MLRIFLSAITLSGLLSGAALADKWSHENHHSAQFGGEYDGDLGLNYSCSVMGRRITLTVNGAFPGVASVIVDGAEVLQLDGEVEDNKTIFEIYSDSESEESDILALNRLYLAMIEGLELEVMQGEEWFGVIDLEDARPIGNCISI